MKALTFEQFSEIAARHEASDVSLARQDISLLLDHYAFARVALGNMTTRATNAEADRENLIEMLIEDATLCPGEQGRCPKAPPSEDMCRQCWNERLAEIRAAQGAA